MHWPFIRSPFPRLSCALGRPLALFGLVLVLSAAPTASNAQTQAEIDRALSRLSEILGALSHLETICAPALRGGFSREETEDEQTRRTQSRTDMENLLDSEELSPLRRSVLIDAYNRGFRAVANIHQRCTPASDRLIALHHSRGAQIVEELLEAAEEAAVTADDADDTPVSEAP